MVSASAYLRGYVRLRRSRERFTRWAGAAAELAGCGEGGGCTGETSRKEAVKGAAPEAGCRRGAGGTGESEEKGAAKGAAAQAGAVEARAAQEEPEKEAVAELALRKLSAEILKECGGCKVQRGILLLGSCQREHWFVFCS